MTPSFASHQVLGLYHRSLFLTMTILRCPLHELCPIRASFFRIEPPCQQSSLPGRGIRTILTVRDTSCIGSERVTETRRFYTRTLRRQNNMRHIAFGVDKQCIEGLRRCLHTLNVLIFFPNLDVRLEVRYLTVGCHVILCSLSAKRGTIGSS